MALAIGIIRKINFQTGKASMKILCIGAGAIGICIGGSISAMGADVIFLERPQQRKDLEGKMLTIHNQGFSLKATDYRLISDYRELGNEIIDCVLIAVKAFDTDQVINQIKQSGINFKNILCLQNGVENEGKLQKAFPRVNVMGASMVSAVSRLDATTVRVERNRGIGLCGKGPVMEQLFDLLKAGGLKPKIFNQLESMKWSKMISNLFSNATSGILDITPMEVYSRNGLFQIEKNQILEGLNVMKKSGYRIVNLPGLPLKLLVFAISYLPDFLLQPLLIQLIAKGRGEKMPSFYIEKMKGSKMSEVDFLNGAIVRKGAETGIATPVNAALVRIFNLILEDPKCREEYSRNPDLLEKTIQA
jgi:2-dehydropantoate 2-reductase